MSLDSSSPYSLVMVKPAVGLILLTNPALRDEVGHDRKVSERQTDDIPVIERTLIYPSRLGTDVVGN